MGIIDEAKKQATVRTTNVHTGFEDRLGRCLIRAYFMDSVDHTKRLECLFNPEEISAQRSAEWGELNPIGWSSTTQQYAHTKSPQYSISLVFSRIAMLERNVNYVDFQEAIWFFNSFLHGEYAGRAPHFLMFVWQKTMHTINTVRSVTTGYKRWSRSGTLMEFTIDLELKEIRQSWLGSGEVGIHGGYLLPDHRLTTNSVLRSMTGKPARFSGKRYGKL